MTSLLFAAAAPVFLLLGAGRDRGILDLLCAVLGDIIHLEDHLECCVEHFVEALLLLGGAADVALEGVLPRSFLDLGIGDAVLEGFSVTVLLVLLSQVELRANKDAGAGAGSRLDLRDPLLAGVLKGGPIHEGEADDEAVGVCVGNRAESAQVFVARSVPNLQFHFAAFVVLRTVVSVEDSWLIEGGERLLGPRHDD